MESQRSLCLLWVLSACCFFCSCEAYTFYVGGRDGWVINPRESYNHWAGRNRFQVNDTIVFENKKGSDSVLLVNKEDYSNCNTKKPLEIMSSGSAVFKFNQSGPFYFISGDEDHCNQGQKLIVVVLAVRPKQSPPGHYPRAPPPSGTGSPSQTPAASPANNHPSPSPQSHAQPPAAAPEYPSTPANSPGVAPPAQAPVPSHGANTPHPAKAPSSPTLPPEHATSPSPSPNYTPFPPALSPMAPSSTPSSKSPATSPSSTPVPSAPSPASTPTSPSTPAADTPQSSPGSQTPPPGSGSQNVNTPASSASWVVTPWNMMWILASILFSSNIVGVYA